jgi:hypothetical protein
MFPVKEVSCKWSVPFEESTIFVGIRPVIFGRSLTPEDAAGQRDARNVCRFRVSADRKHIFARGRPVPDHSQDHRAQDQIHRQVGQTHESYVERAVDDADATESQAGQRLSAARLAVDVQAQASIENSRKMETALKEPAFLHSHGVCMLL